VHLSYIGHPVAADRVYGSGRRPPGLQRQFVHAYHLEVESPATGERLVLEAPLPPDLAEPLERLREAVARPAGGISAPAATRRD
jgi:23S rRNA pseudouridine1911/1915/1917 synthase